MLFLFLLRTREQMSEKTRLTFSVTLEGRLVSTEAFATWDGKPISYGDKVSIGRHSLVVGHPKGVIFSTNYFVWYGPQKFGAIPLKRAMGTLKIDVNPPAPLLSINGPEWSLTLRARFENGNRLILSKLLMLYNISTLS